MLDSRSGSVVTTAGRCPAGPNRKEPAYAGETSGNGSASPSVDWSAFLRRTPLRCTEEDPAAVACSVACEELPDSWVVGADGAGGLTGAGDGGCGNCGCGIDGRGAFGVLFVVCAAALCGAGTNGVTAVDSVFASTPLVVSDRAGANGARADQATVDGRLLVVVAVAALCARPVSAAADVCFVVHCVSAAVASEAALRAGLWAALGWPGTVAPAAECAAG